MVIGHFQQDEATRPSTSTFSSHQIRNYTHANKAVTPIFL